MTPPAQVAPGVHRLGSELVNFYLLEQDGRYTVVDAGLPRWRGRLESALETLGHSVHDVEAVILTHAHPDHTGFAGPLQRDTGTPVHVHEADAEMARTTKTGKRERAFAPYLRNAAARKLVRTLATGGLPRKIPELITFADGAELDVAGRPRVIHAPGHSDGCVTFHLPDRGVLFTGDVLCNRNPLTGRVGPQIPPGGFNVSSAQAIASLDRLESLQADLVLFGHGEPWTGGVAAAVARAREAGPS